MESVYFDRKAWLRYVTGWNDGRDDETGAARGSRASDLDDDYRLGYEDGLNGEYNARYVARGNRH